MYRPLERVAQKESELAAVTPPRDGGPAAIPSALHDSARPARASPIVQLESAQSAESRAWADAASLRAALMTAQEEAERFKSASALALRETQVSLLRWGATPFPRLNVS